MPPGPIRMNYILYIGAGAVTAGGIISMLQALPMIVGSMRGADWRSGRRMRQRQIGRHTHATARFAALARDSGRQPGAGGDVWLRRRYPGTRL